MRPSSIGLKVERQLGHGRGRLAAEHRGPVRRTGSPSCRAPIAAPPRAINNQRSHLLEELLDLQAHINKDLAHDQETARHSSSNIRRSRNSHVFHEQNADGYYGGLDSEPAFSAGHHAHQLNNGHRQHTAHNGPSALEPSTMAPATRHAFALHKSRVSSYPSAKHMASELSMFLNSGTKVVLDCPEDPDLVSRLLAALGQAASELHRQGIAVAVDPVPLSDTLPASPSAVNGSSCGPYAVVVRAVPLPPPVPPAPSQHSSTGEPAPVYVVGTSVGQEVLRAGPDPESHPLCARLLRGILRDGLVTVRCCWQDDELAAQPLMAGSDAQADECDCSGWLEGGDWSASAAAHNAPASVVRVPGVLRSILKVDRQLRSRGLHGLVLLPHTFTVCSPTTLVVYMDVVLA